MFGLVIHDGHFHGVSLDGICRGGNACMDLDEDGSIAGILNGLYRLCDPDGWLP